jgi:hypothetical protein
MWSFSFDFRGNFLALHLDLALPTQQTSVNSVKEWAKYGVFGVRGYIIQ